VAQRLLKTRRLSLPIHQARGQNRREGFSGVQFFNSAGVHEFAITCKVVTRHIVLYGQVEGTRSRGRQPKKWIDNVKEDLAAQGMNMREAMDNSRNRRIWRSLVEASSLANA